MNLKHLTRLVSVGPLDIGVDLKSWLFVEFVVILVLWTACCEGESSFCQEEV